MYIGRVSGTVVATIKNELFQGRKLLVVDRLNLQGKPTGRYDIAVDMVQAGTGDLVLVLDEGNSARPDRGPGAQRRHPGRDRGHRGRSGHPRRDL